MVIEFNYPIDIAAFKAGATLTPSVAGRWTYNPRTMWATFRAEEPLPLDTEFTLQASQPLLDASGMILGTL